MSLIDRVRIDKPCSALWEQMSGDERARFCRLCNKHVHNVEALTTCEVDAILAGPTLPCLRVRYDASGLALTRDRIARYAAIAATAALAACAPGGDSGETAALSLTTDGTTTERIELIPELSAPMPGQARILAGEPVMAPEATTPPEPTTPSGVTPPVRPGQAVIGPEEPRMGKMALPVPARGAGDDDRRRGGPSLRARVR
jgi:hypothetical protein